MCIISKVIAIAWHRAAGENFLAVCGNGPLKTVSFRFQPENNYTKNADFGGSELKNIKTAI